VKRPSFWIPSLTLATISGTSQATITILVPHAVGLGLDVTRAALLISAFAAAAATAKVLAGLMADRVNPRFMLVAAALLMMLSWIVLGGFSGYAFLFAAGCLAGAALGCALPTTNALIAAAFGSHRFASVTGWTYMLIFSFAIAAVRFSGWVYDSGASYQPAFRTFAVLLACLLLATFQFARRGKAA
jgi:MFS family permease